MSGDVLVILQARMSSSRFPGKVLNEINGKPMIFWQVQRIRKSKISENLIVATSTDVSDDPLEHYLRSNNIRVARGPLNNVYKRFSDILISPPKYQIVVRLTGDCPLVMPNLIDHAVKLFKESDLDYLSNTICPTYPDGLDVEVFYAQAFLRLKELNLTEAEKEHVTLAFHRKSLQIKSGNFSNDQDLSRLRWTVDYKEDLDFVRKIYKKFQGHETTFDFSDILKLLENEPWLNSDMSGTLRNEALQSLTEEGPNASI